MIAKWSRRPIDAAIVYGRRGWPVFPCHGPSHGVGGCTCFRADCGSPAKHPRVSGGLNSATTDEALIRRWWSSWPAANVAIRTGQASGLVVLDVDPDHGGDESLAQVIEQHGPLPPGRTIQTGGGGRHLYFRHPGGVVRNDAGRKLGAGIDIRDDGGYVLAPPSRHVSGGRYAVVQRGGELPTLPGWLLAAVQPPEIERRPPATTSGVRDASAWARSALDGELHRLQAAVEGTRNDTLNRVAYRLGQIVAAGCLDEAEVEAILVHAASSIGLGEREAVRTVHSGLTAGESNPRGPAGSPGPDMPSVHTSADSL